MDNPYYEKSVNAALRFISFRPRSEKELKDFLSKKLARWKVSGRLLIEKVINRMRELGYADDRAFAVWWRDQRVNFKPRGVRFIAMELARKGISKDLIDETLFTQASGESPFDEFRNAKNAIKKKAVTWVKLPIIEQKKKTYTYLAQRGFSPETIGKIIDGLPKKEYNGETEKTK